MRESGGITHRSRIEIGGVSIDVGGERSSDVALIPLLQPFRTSADFSDIDLDVQWVESLIRPSGRAIFDSGSAWSLYGHEEELQFDFNAPILGDEPYKRLFVDEQFRRGTLQMNQNYFEGTEYSVAPLDYPLDELLIMHRLTQERAIELHGCGIVRADGIGNLFVGHSGAGKSTTTRLWTEWEDVEVLSDDRIIVRRDGGEKQLPHRRSAAVRNDISAEKQVPPRRFATGRNDIGDVARKNQTGIRMYGTPWHGEAMYASPNSAPLARIFVLEHGHGNVLKQLSRSQAVAELFARSFVPFHRHEYVESALDFLEEVADAVPVYRYEFEPDQRAIDVIANLRD